MAEVVFDVESEAEPLLIVSTRDAAGRPVNQVVTLTPPDAEKRTGSLDVSSDQTHFLTWIFNGSPGTAYKITLSPQEKIKLKRLQSPIESSIATTRLTVSGSDQFKVTP